MHQRRPAKSLTKVLYLLQGAVLQWDLWSLVGTLIAGLIGRLLNFLNPFSWLIGIFAGFLANLCRARGHLCWWLAPELYCAFLLANLLACLLQCLNQILRLSVWRLYRWQSRALYRFLVNHVMHEQNITFYFVAPFIEHWSVCTEFTKPRCPLR